MVVYNDREFRLVLIGMTGVGKSATGNTILNEACFKSVPTQESVTEKCEYYRRRRFDKNVMVVDTPGLLDTRMEKETISKEIKKCIGISAPGPHAFLLVTSTYHRFTEEAASVFNEIDEMFGVNMKKHVIVIFTGKDNIPSSMSLEEYAEKTPKKLKEILSSAGGGYIAFGNKGNDKEKQLDVRQLLQQVEKMVEKNRESHFSSEMFEEAERIMQERIQKEIVEEKKRKLIQHGLHEAEQMLKRELEDDQQSNNPMEAKTRELKIELGRTKEGKSNTRYFSERERALEDLVKQEMTTQQMKNTLIQQKTHVRGDERAQIEGKLVEVEVEISKITTEKKKMEYEVISEILSLNVREEERIKIEDEDMGAVTWIMKGLKESGLRFLSMFRN